VSVFGRLEFRSTYAYEFERQTTHIHPTPLTGTPSYFCQKRDELHVLEDKDEKDKSQRMRMNPIR